MILNDVAGLTLQLHSKDTFRRTVVAHQPSQDYMTDLGTPSPLLWRFKHLSESSSSVPESPGVYAIGHLKSLHGLELKREYVYVGESNNLKRRLDEHLPNTEQKADLKAYLRKHYAALLCWYLPTEANQRWAIQNQLIDRIQPRFNIQGRKPAPHDEEAEK